MLETGSPVCDSCLGKKGEIKWQEKRTGVKKVELSTDNNSNL
jgi:hypothetical protein